MKSKLLSKPVGSKYQPAATPYTEVAAAGADAGAADADAGTGIKKEKKGNTRPYGTFKSVESWVKPPTRIAPASSFSIKNHLVGRCKPLGG